MNQQLVMLRVIQDLAERNEVGIRKYGEPLKTFNGRNALQDAYEEALDLAQYLKQRLMEEEAIVPVPPLHNHTKDHHPEDNEGMPPCPACDWFQETMSTSDKRYAEDRERIRHAAQSAYQDGPAEWGARWNKETPHNHLPDGQTYDTCIACQKNEEAYLPIMTQSSPRSGV